MLPKTPDDEKRPQRNKRRSERAQSDQKWRTTVKASRSTARVYLPSHKRTSKPTAKDSVAKIRNSMTHCETATLAGGLFRSFNFMKTPRLCGYRRRTCMKAKRRPENKIKIM